MKLFPTIVAGIFIALALISVLIFATFSSHNSNSVGNVTVWGTLPEETFRSFVDIIGKDNQMYTGVRYTLVSLDTLVPSLVSAIASGQGPDLVMLPSEDLVAQSSKFQTIPYSAYSRRQFQDTFVESGEVALVSNGELGLPFSVDPLVMYWNRSLFSAAGVSQPPVYWDDLSSIVPKLSKTDANGTLTQSTAALGTWDNIVNAKAIFLSILHGLGNSVVAPSTTGSGYVPTLVPTTGAVSSGDSALRYYSEFADPVKPVYSWNRSQSSSYDQFIRGKLAIYFGRVSELLKIRSANPNLNFDVAPLPSVRGGVPGAEAALTMLVIPRGSQNPQGALAVANALTGQSIQGAVMNALHTPSVRRDTNAGTPADPYSAIFTQAALSSFSFPDPDPTATDALFKRMVEDVNSGAASVSEAVANASASLAALLGVQ